MAEWRQFGPTEEPYRATCDQWPSGEEVASGGLSGTVAARIPGSELASALRPSGGVVGDDDPVELADRALVEVLEVLRSDDDDRAERVCEDWEPRLFEASDTVEEFLRSEIGRDPRHRFWTIDIAVHLCAGRGFGTALTYLESIAADPEGACVGYPSPCPTPRRWFDS